MAHREQGAREPMSVTDDPARWFESLGVCRCGKPATGTLRGVRDEAIEVCCAFCARGRIDKAERNRGLDPRRGITERGQEWWERQPAPMVRKAACPHGHADWDDCPVCCH